MRHEACHDPAEADSDQRHALARFVVERTNTVDQPIALRPDRPRTEITPKSPPLGAVAERNEIAPQEHVRPVAIEETGQQQHRSPVAARPLRQCCSRKGERCQTESPTRHFQRP